MNFQDYEPVLNSNVKIFKTDRGHITVDPSFHKLLYQLVLIYHWRRYENYVGTEFMWNSLYTITNSNSSDDSLMIFNSDGTLRNPPPFLEIISAREREFKLLLSIKNESHNWSTLLLTSASFALICSIILAILRLFFSHFFRATTMDRYVIDALTGNLQR